MSSNNKKEQSTNHSHDGPHASGSRQELDTDTNQNEGDGSQTAAHRYNHATEDYARSGKVEAAARKAEEALDGEEGGELRRAEEEGKMGPDWGSNRR